MSQLRFIIPPSTNLTTLPLSLTSISKMRCPSLNFLINKKTKEEYLLSREIKLRPGRPPATKIIWMTFDGTSTPTNFFPTFYSFPMTASMAQTLYMAPPHNIMYFPGVYLLVESSWFLAVEAKMSWVPAKHFLLWPGCEESQPRPPGSLSLDVPAPCTQLQLADWAPRTLDASRI